MKINTGKTFIKLLCFILFVMFVSIASDVFATCLDGDGNCDIPKENEFQIDNKRALKMSESYSPAGCETVSGFCLRDIFMGENSGVLNPNADGRGFGNVFIGRNTGSLMELGGVNTFIGDGVGKNLKYGLHNTYIGAGVGGIATSDSNAPNEYSPSYNTIIGSIAGGQNLGAGNVFVGTEAGRYNTTGSDNIGIGIAALANYTNPYGYCSDGKCVSSTGFGNVHVGIYTGTKSPDLYSTIALGSTPIATENNQMVVGSHQPHHLRQYKITACGTTEPRLCQVNSTGYDTPSTCNVTDPPEIDSKGMASITIACKGYVGLIRESYWGSGVTSPDPQAFSFNASGGHGPNVAGADLIMAGGKSTGNANGGRLVFRTSPKGASSSSNSNALVDRMVIDSEGRIGFGGNPWAMSQIYAKAKNRVRALTLETEVNNGGSSYVVSNIVNRTDASTIGGEIVGIGNNIFLMNSGDLGSESAVYPFSNSIVFDSATSGTSDVNSYLFTGAYFSQGTGPRNVRNFNILNPASNVESWGVTTDQGTGTATYNDFRHAWLRDSQGGVLHNQTGLWIDKQTRGSENYGIVLDGDGEGADITFGLNQETSIYSNGGELFAKDGANNVTQISPHDPETGEWVFYSKNTKTGRVLRVNMEELVKDMENITGKKYLIESFVNEK